MMSALQGSPHAHMQGGPSGEVGAAVLLVAAALVAAVAVQWLEHVPLPAAALLVAQLPAAHLAAAAATAGGHCAAAFTSHCLSRSTMQQTSHLPR